EDVKEYIRTCDICQRRGPTNWREELIPIPVKGPFHRIGIDIKGPLPIASSGNRYLIIAMDYFTKWPEARAISNIKAETVANLFMKKLFVDMELQTNGIVERFNRTIGECIAKLVQDNNKE
ncbi:14916_t:CDS:2, partial [Rhizophagus irregularis]